MGKGKVLHDGIPYETSRGTDNARRGPAGCQVARETGGSTGTRRTSHCALVTAALIRPGMVEFSFRMSLTTNWRPARLHLGDDVFNLLPPVDDSPIRDFPHSWTRHLYT
jgi:hypothetical protein